MLDREALRRLAEAATPGPWHIEIESEGGDFGSIISTSITGVKAEKDWIFRLDDDYGTGAAPRHDSKYIAAANPQTILALLDELEAAEREIV